MERIKQYIKENWKSLTAGVVAGIILGALLF